MGDFSYTPLRVHQETVGVFWCDGKIKFVDNIMD